MWWLRRSETLRGGWPASATASSTPRARRRVRLTSRACARRHVGLFRGRIGGWVFKLYGDRVVAGKIPYRDFSLEYPPGALPPLVVPSFFPSGDYDKAFMWFELLCGLACIVLVALALASPAVRSRRVYSPGALP